MHTLYRHIRYPHQLALHFSQNAAFILFTLSLLLVVTPTAGAAFLSNRSVVILTALSDASTSHQFNFTINTSSSVGSIGFEYCDNSPLNTVSCSAPAGLDVSGVGLASQSGQTGFSIHANTSINRIVIGRPPLLATPGAVSYTFTSAINPSQPNRTTYVRLNTYASDDGSGPSTDEGAVAFSLGTGLAVSAYIPPYLAVCVGVTVSNNCATTSGLGINLGTLRSQQPSTGTTQIGAATNDVGGYSLSLLGNTLTAGNNFIPALAAPTGSIPGTGQFGINLRSNTNPTVGQNIIGNGTSLVANPYGQTNLFMFHSGDMIALSSVSTDYNIFTVSYLANIPNDQAPGLYSTTITYVALASF